MRFSVIMPVYNRESCVANAIMSVVEQRFDDWELIVVDDGSKDNTREVCQKFSEDEARIKVLTQPNKGVSAARNAGMDAASGDYVLFLDSDDHLEADAMACLTKLIQENQFPDILCFGFYGISGGQWMPEESISGKLYDKQWINEYILPEHVNVHPQTEWFLQPFVWNKCFKRSLLQEHNIRLDEERKTWEDNVFLVFCLAKAQSIFISEQILYKMGDSGADDHLSKVCNPNLLFGYIKTYEEYSQHFGQQYNFENSYTHTRYFTLTCDILRRMQNSVAKEEFDDVLDKVVNNRYVRLWIKKAKTKKVKPWLIKLVISIKNKALLKRLLQEKESLLHRVKVFLSKIKRKMLK